MSTKKDLLDALFKLHLITSILLGLFLSCCNHKESDPENSYLKEWEQFNTELIKEEKSFQKYEEFENERKNILSLRQTEVFLPNLFIS